MSAEEIMGTLRESVVPEADERAAPLVFAYIFGVLGWLGAVLAWVFWFRGYA